VLATWKRQVHQESSSVFAFSFCNAWLWDKAAPKRTRRRTLQEFDQGVLEHTPSLEPKMTSGLTNIHGQTRNAQRSAIWNAWEDMGNWCSWCRQVMIDERSNLVHCICHVFVLRRHQYTPSQATSSYMCGMAPLAQISPHPSAQVD
jgi:hypothetical protein